MAVKVMVATAIANGEIEKPARAATRGIASAPKAKRRRSSVYDADGNEVFITLLCLKCHRMRPLSQFGLRKMADGAIRNQPWCRSCRAAAGADKPVRKGSAGMEESAAANASPSLAATQDTPEPRQRSSSIAAEVAAALAAGLRR